MTLLRAAAKLAFVVGDALLPSPSGPRILIYHQIGAGLGRQMEVETHDFVWQLDWLADNREVVDFESAVTRWDEPGSERLVALTFDDGYSDTFSTAFPLLVERDMPFMLYISSGMVEANTDGMMLSWDEIRSMSSSGLLTLGAHTHNHMDLRHLGVDEIRAELEQSDRLIEQRLGQRPAHFAYPWGYWSSHAHDEVAGRYATATLGSPVGRVEFDPHKIHRYPIQLSDGRRWFEHRLRGGLLLEEVARRRLRGYAGSEPG